MKPLLLNNLEFAASAKIASGNIQIMHLQRLSDLLAVQVNAQNAGKIEYELSGTTKQLGQPSLHLSIEAELPTLCQRCLNAMQVRLSLYFDYLISDAEPAELDDNDDLDWLEPSREMNVWQLIEDELLIAFPIAPTHSPAQQDICTQHPTQSGEKPNPFAALKTLQQNFNKKTG